MARGLRASDYPVYSDETLSPPPSPAHRAARAAYRAATITDTPVMRARVHSESRIADSAASYYFQRDFRVRLLQIGQI